MKTAAFLSRIMIVVLTGLLVVACTTTKFTDQPLPDAPKQTKLHLKPGDNIDVKFRYWPELDESQKVRPDGRITLQLVDEVDVAGLTPAELDAKLTLLYKDKIKDPVISVIVRELISQRIFVGGEVNRSGHFPLEGRMTVLSAIIAAGGINNQSANLKKVVVIRHRDGKRYAAEFDIKKSLIYSESGLFVLAPQDIVWVPRTKIDEVNQWVEQHISRILPQTGYTSLIRTN
jgi:polysaccharide biosynthesis/export protein PslD